MSVNALLIEPGKPELQRITLNGDADTYHRHMAELIGDSFSSALHVRSDHGRRLYVWCDDMGAYKTEQPWNILLGETLRVEPFPLRGPVLITACDEIGDTVPMTESEIRSLLLLPARPFDFPGGAGYMGPIPPEHIVVPVLQRV